MVDEHTGSLEGGVVDGHPGSLESGVVDGHPGSLEGGVVDGHPVRLRLFPKQTHEEVIGRSSTLEAAALNLPQAPHHPRSDVWYPAVGAVHVHLPRPGARTDAAVQRLDHFSMRERRRLYLSE